MGLNDKKKMETTSYPPSRRSFISDHIAPGCTRSETLEDARNQQFTVEPCYNGKSLKIDEELVVNGLSAISIKHVKGNCSKNSSEKSHLEDQSSKPSGAVEDKLEKSQKTGTPDCLGEGLKNRNSFWNVHRPELSKLSWPENYVSPSVLQEFFHSHIQNHGTFCEPLHACNTRSSIVEEELRDYSRLREIVPPRNLPPDEKLVNIKEKSRSVQLKDEDLPPEIIVHKSRAEFCVTIGECIRRPPLKRSTSQQMKPDKSSTKSTNRIESLPLQHEGLLAKETMYSEERLSNIMGNSAIYVDTDSTAVSKTFRPPLSSETLPNASTGVLPRPHDQVTEDSGDPARLRTILSPRDEDDLPERRRQNNV